MDFCVNVIKDVLMSVYQYFGAALALSFVFMYLYMQARESGWKKTLLKFPEALKNDITFRRAFLFAFYTAMLLFKTFLCRSYWDKPLKNVLGTWWIYDADGQFYTEGFENIILFIPFTFLFAWTFGERMFKNKKVSFFRTAVRMMWVSFLTSAAIEVCQLIFRAGTFQISDMVFNTAGGLIGGIIYYVFIGRKLKE